MKNFTQASAELEQLLKEVVPGISSDEKLSVIERLRRFQDPAQTAMDDTTEIAALRLAAGTAATELRNALLDGALRDLAGRTAEWLAIINKLNGKTKKVVEDSRKLRLEWAEGIATFADEARTKIKEVRDAINGDDSAKAVASLEVLLATVGALTSTFKK